MIKGTTRTEIDTLKKINLITYFKITDLKNISIRTNGTIVHNKNSKMVIYDDHSYTFDDVSHPYKDIIGTLQEIYGYGFMETIEKLRAYKNIYGLK